MWVSAGGMVVPDRWPYTHLYLTCGSALRTMYSFLSMYLEIIFTSQFIEPYRGEKINQDARIIWLLPKALKMVSVMFFATLCRKFELDVWIKYCISYCLASFRSWSKCQWHKLNVLPFKSLDMLVRILSKRQLIILLIPLHSHYLMQVRCTSLISSSLILWSKHSLF